MRNAFAEEITELAQKDGRLMLLSGDIGNRLFDGFKYKFGDRFINCGVAEANMIGVASGLALAGMRPFVYTITPFLTARCYEQIKIDVCYQNAPVVIVGTGSGLSYAALGPTHHSLEDIAIMRQLPNMRVFAPCDSRELVSVLREIAGDNSPAYIRIGKKGEPLVHNDLPSESALEGYKVGEFLGKTTPKIAFLASGTIVSEVKKAAEILLGNDIGSYVYSIPSVKPLNCDLIKKLGGKIELMVTVEEHNCTGGLGGAVSEMLHHLELDTKLVRLGASDKFMHNLGSQDYAREFYSIDHASIVAILKEKCEVEGKEA